MKEQEFDHTIKQKLEALSNEPPIYMWDKISAAIPPPLATVPSKKAMSAATKLILLAAFVIIVTGLSFLLLQQNNTAKRTGLKSIQYTDEKVIIRPHKYIRIDKEEQYQERVLPQTTDDVQTTKTVGINRNAVNQNRTLKNEKLPNTLNQEFDRAYQETVQASTPQPELQFTTLPEKDKVKTKANKKELGIRLTEINQTGDEHEGEVQKNILPKTESKKEQLVAIIDTTEDASKKVAIVEDNNEEVAITVHKEPVATNTENEKTEKLSREESIILKDNPKNRQLNKYGIGIHYGPEFMDIGKNKLNDHAVDFSFNYQNLNFILQTGLGLRYSQEKVGYNLKYRRWDYIETQVRFDSAIFVVDKNGNVVLQPVDPYYEDVYDSVRHSYSATATEQYYILQIPLSVGYQRDYKKIAFFVKGGIRYSLLVFTHTNNLFEIDEASHLDFISYPSKGRAVSNIDFEMSIGGIYKMTKKFQVHAECFGRYYQYSIYSEYIPSGIHPWSISGRIGFVYLLN